MSSQGTVGVPGHAGFDKKEKREVDERNAMKVTDGIDTLSARQTFAIFRVCFIMSHSMRTAMNDACASQAPTMQHCAARVLLSAMLQLRGS